MRGAFERGVRAEAGGRASGWEGGLSGGTLPFPPTERNESEPLSQTKRVLARPRALDHASPPLIVIVDNLTLKYPLICCWP